nr:hypothetical protein [Tanacetum cinerariifolium]
MADTQRDSLAYLKLSSGPSIYSGLEVDSIRRIGYAIFDFWIRRIDQYAKSDFLDTEYRPIRSIGVFGYGVLAENVFFLIFDQSIIYGVYTDVDTAYSSKSCNNLEFFKVFGYGVLMSESVAFSNS